MSNYQEIDYATNYGSAEGYCVDSDSVQLANWLEKHGFSDEKIINEIRKNYKRIAIIENVNVYSSDQRGKGNGTEIFNSIISQACDEYASAILLVADLKEKQNDGFCIKKWYKGWDFEVIKENQSGALMIWDADD
jgi:hypothetical protein